MPTNTDYHQGDKVEYYCPKVKQWLKGIFQRFHVPESAPLNAKWTYAEILINNKIHNAYSLRQIRHESTNSISTNHGN